MKKLILTIAIVLGLAMTSFAQGGLFQRGESPDKGGNREGSNAPLLPLEHGGTNSADADQVPVGTGIAILAALGGAYLVGKRRREE